MCQGKIYKQEWNGAFIPVQFRNLGEYSEFSGKSNQQLQFRMKNCGGKLRKFLIKILLRPAFWLFGD